MKHDAIAQLSAKCSNLKKGSKNKLKTIIFPGFLGYVNLVGTLVWYQYGIMYGWNKESALER